jgi:hypothetical protein
MKFTRVCAQPSADTLSIPPIRDFVLRHLRGVSVDPFARNERLATWTNDLNPDTAAAFHMEAEAFARHLAAEGVVADVLIFDPPYSPRQISECYQLIGREVTNEDTQNAALYGRVRDAALAALSPTATVLSFGWNSVGMGKARGFEITEILLVSHGGAHNDTICVAERRVQTMLDFGSEGRAA